MRKMIACTALMVAACAGTQSYPGPYVLEGNAKFVRVGWAASRTGNQGALQVADQHCAQYGKVAQYSGKPNDFSAAYNCVKDD